jgi:hypothetical protein
MSRDIEDYISIHYISGIHSSIWKCRSYCGSKPDFHHGIMVCTGNLTSELNRRTNEVNGSESVKTLHKLNLKTIAGIAGENHGSHFLLFLEKEATSTGQHCTHIILKLFIVLWQSISIIICHIRFRRSGRP